MLRKMLLTAAVIAPLAWTPAHAAAQERGTDRAAAVGAATQAAGPTNGRAEGRPTELPPEIAALFADQALPPGLANTREVAADQGDGTGETQGEGGEDECTPVPVIVDGKLMIQNCDGTLSDPFGGTE